MTGPRTITVPVTYAVTARQVETILCGGEVESMSPDQAVWLVGQELRINGLGATDGGVAAVGRHFLADPDGCARRLAVARELAERAFPGLYAEPDDSDTETTDSGEASR